LEPLIETKNLYKTFKKNSQNINVLKNINLKIYKGDKIAIVGKSGAGKTTLLHIMGTLEYPTKGNIFFKNIDITNLSENQLAHLRGDNIGFVFQFHYLINEFTALENVILPSLVNKIRKKEVIERANFLLDKLGLKNRKLHKPSELSGGEQQRLSIARALINNPEILLTDEPTGNLDSQTSQQTFDLLDDIYEETGMTIVVVTHNKELSDRFQRKIILEDGYVKKEIC
jgi:lipoprotein-releasing system ATP-binding protein